MENTLVIGGNGFLGSAISSCLKSSDSRVLSTSRNPKFRDQLFLDLGDASSFQIPTGVRSAIICSGISGKTAERNPDYSQLINVVGTRILLEKLIEKSIRICFISTSSVFNSEQNFATEFDTPSPKTLYGSQKLEIESFLSLNSQNYIIIRPTKILGNNCALFSMWKKMCSEGKNLRINRHAKVAPISIDYVVNIIGQTPTNDKMGIFHLSAPSLISLEEVLHNYALRIGDLGQYSIDFYSDLGEIPDSSCILSSTRTNEWKDIVPESFQSFLSKI